jgi:hypothetical protein
MTCGNYAYDRAWKVSFGEAGLSIEHASDDLPRDALPFDLSAVKGSVSAGDGVGRRRVTVKQGDDWLVGFDAGEFGGSLWWFSGDGKRAKKLSQGNITHFVDLSGTTYALEGLDHLDLSGGSVLRVEKTAGGDFVVKKVTDLDGRPYATAVESPSSFLVLTKNGLRRFRGTRGIEKLAESDYGSLYPTSIAVTPDGTVYAGMRNFVTRFVPKDGSYKEEWLVPDSCAHFTVDKRNLRCVCSEGK